MKSKVDTIVALAEDFLHVSNEPMQFGHQRLLPSERELLKYVAMGDILKLSSLDEEPGRTSSGEFPKIKDDDSDDSKSAVNDCRVRGRLIRWLCADPQAKALVDPFGIQVQGAEILGTDSSSEAGGRFMTLASLVIPFPVVLTQCRLPSRLLLLGAEIPFLNLAGSRVGALEADMLRIKGDLYLRHGFQACGCVTLDGASIGGDLDCTGAQFDGQKHEGQQDYRVSLRAAGIKVAGDVLLSKWEPLDGGPDKPFVANGIVSLEGARIEGDLRCEGGSFLGPRENVVTGSHSAIAASRMEVSGSVFLGEGFRANAEVNFTSAQVGGNFEGGKGSFEHESLNSKEFGDALCMDGIKIARDLNLSESCVQGRLRFSGSEIGGDLDCEGCKVRGEVVGQRATVKGIWFWRGVATAELRKLDFRDTSVGGIVDENRSWPAEKVLTLDGFQYDRFSRAPKSAYDRLKWLELQKEFAPQPYRQLSKVLREDGDVSGARKVLFEMENLRHRNEMNNLRSQIPIALGSFRGCLLKIWISLQKAWYWILRNTVGYGYYPQLALYWLVVLTLLGWFVFWRAYDLKAITPTDSAAYRCFQSNGYPPEYYQRFHALAYSLANTFPVLNIGKTESWQPDQNPRAPVQPGVVLYFLRRRITYPAFLMLFRYGQIFVGWLLTTLGVAAITGLTHKE